MNNTLYHNFQKLRKIQNTGLPIQQTLVQRNMIRLLRKYQLTDADIKNHCQAEYFFKFRNKRERQLLHQVVMMVTNAAVVSRIDGNSAGIFMTKFQFCQIQELYKIYRQAFNRRLKHITTTALHDFIQENAIFPDHAIAN